MNFLLLVCRILEFLKLLLVVIDKTAFYRTYLIFKTYLLKLFMNNYFYYNFIIHIITIIIIIIITIIIIRYDHATISIHRKIWEASGELRTLAICRMIPFRSPLLLCLYNLNYGPPTSLSNQMFVQIASF